MRIIIIFLLLSCSNCGMLRADEGMFNISLNKTLYNTLIKKGLSLSIDDICGDKSSLKDAIVMFGNGGTGVVVSNKGLLLTNYHLVSRFIPSSIQNDGNSLEKGYYAKNIQEEIPMKNLFICFQIKEIDITSYILKDLNLLKNYTEKQREVKFRIDQYIKDNTPKNTGFVGNVKEMYGGNKYFYYLLKVYNDIRLVALPPISLAKFGGEKFNWEWPRYSADFAMLRIYSNEKNEPANYSCDNVPYKPSKVISFSTKEISENDFTMVVGFPGSTYFSEPSSFIENVILTSNDRRIPLMNYKIRLLENFMYKSDSLYKKYYSIYSSLNNNVKNREGLLDGIKITKGLDRKILKEDVIKDDILIHSDLNRRYLSLLDSIANITSEVNGCMIPYDYMRSGILSVDLLNIAFVTYTNLIKINSVKENTRDRVLRMIKEMYNHIDLEVDRKIFLEMVTIYTKKVHRKYIPEILNVPQTPIEDICDDIYSNSLFLSYEKIQKKILDEPDRLLDDPAIKIVAGLDSLLDRKIISKLLCYEKMLDSLKREYKSINFVFDKYSWPDANRTLRLSYGNVVNTNFAAYYTKYDGLFKEMTKEKDLYAFIPPIISQILLENNPNCILNFITNCHTTSGNSGSPVLNSRGELIGLNFDRIKESVVGDYIYDASICRNISLTTNYIIYVLDKIGNAKNIINELNILN